MVKVVFLGTNGWFDSPTGNTICTLIETKDFNIVLDAGNGIAKLSSYLNDSKPTYLFISHFHLDHVEGLHTLCLNRFSKGLNIIVQPDGAAHLQTLVELPFTVPFRSMSFSARIIETDGNRCNLPFKTTFLPMQHTPFTQGIRLEVDGVVITHCLDTGYCENAVTLAKNADLLILECTLKPGHVVDYHLCPESCARIARESGARRLALTHFEGKSYPDLATRNASEWLVQTMFAQAFMCVDGLEMVLSSLDSP